MTTKKELIDEIERTANELLGYMDDLQSKQLFRSIKVRIEVDDAVDEAQDTDTTLERLQEIKQALKKVTEEQEQGLNL